MEEMQRRGPGRPPSIRKNETEEDITENRIRSADEIAKKVASGKKMVGYLWMPYANSRKVGFGKLRSILRIYHHDEQRKAIFDKTEQKFLIHDVPMVEGQKLMQLSEDEVPKEHKKREKLPYYGFGRPPYKKQRKAS